MSSAEVRGVVLLAPLRHGDEVLAGDVTPQDGKHFHGIGRLVESLFFNNQ